MTTLTLLAWMLMSPQEIPPDTSVPGREKTVTLRPVVPAARWWGAQLAGANRGATLSIEVKADGPVTVVLVSAEDAERYPDARRPFVREATEGHFEFEMEVPETGNYVVIVDNSAGDQPRRVVIFARITLGDAEAPRPD